MCNILEVADAAEVIVNGYAFTKVFPEPTLIHLQ